MSFTRITILAAYFQAKYAQQEDTSFGEPISAEKTRILKDKLILTYDKLAQGITLLPAFQELNTKLAGNPMLEEFNRLIINLVNYVETRDLKSVFNYTTKLIETLNVLKKCDCGRENTSGRVALVGWCHQKYPRSHLERKQADTQYSRSAWNFARLPSIRRHIREASGSDLGFRPRETTNQTTN
jgi:hypothetical protein